MFLFSWTEDDLGSSSASALGCSNPGHAEPLERHFAVLTIKLGISQADEEIY